MSESDIVAITMPKWGLSMVEGKVIAWLVDEGARIEFGDEILDIETDKIANAFEALDAGILRRKVAQPDQTLPIGALLGVMAGPDVTDEAIDAYVSEFLANYVAPEIDEEETGPVYQWVTVGAYSLRYSKLGEGDDTAILVHGFGGDLDNWLFNHEALAKYATVYAFDLPGHGQSSKTIDDGSIPAMAETLAGFMDALGIEAAHLIGHSLGGAIAIQTGLSHPQKVKSIGLIAPAGLGKKISGDYISGFIHATSRREVKPHLERLFADPKLVNRKLIDDILKFKRLDGVTEALETIAAGFVDGDEQRVDFYARLAGLSMPVQVIWGSRDCIIPPCREHDLPQGISVEIIEGPGHMVQMEAAAEVNQCLRRQFQAGHDQA